MEGIGSRCDSLRDRGARPAGDFDFILEFDDSGLVRPTLVTAIQEQLGLKLQSMRAPVDVLVVERAGMPTPN